MLERAERAELISKYHEIDITCWADKCPRYVITFNDTSGDHHSFYGPNPHQKAVEFLQNMGLAVPEDLRWKYPGMIAPPPDYIPGFMQFKEDEMKEYPPHYFEKDTDGCGQHASYEECWKIIRAAKKHGIILSICYRDCHQSDTAFCDGTLRFALPHEDVQFFSRYHPQTDLDMLREAAGWIIEQRRKLSRKDPSKMLSVECEQELEDAGYTVLGIACNLSGIENLVLCDARNKMPVGCDPLLLSETPLQFIRRCVEYVRRQK